MIRAIAFDLGGVFATNPPRYIIREIALKQDLDVMEVLKAWNRYWTAFICGRLTEDQFFESLIRELHIEGHRRPHIDEFKEFSRHFIAIMPVQFHRIKQIKDVLKKRRLKFAICSNNAREWWEYLDSDHDFSVFDVKVHSFDVKKSKPMTEIYEKLIEELKLKPEEVLFVDDKAANCDGAVREGMSAEQFTSFDALITRLYQLKVMDEHDFKKLKELFEEDIFAKEEPEEPEKEEKKEKKEPEREGDWKEIETEPEKGQKSSEKADKSAEE